MLEGKKPEHDMAWQVSSGLHNDLMKVVDYPGKGHYFDRQIMKALSDHGER